MNTFIFHWLDGKVEEQKANSVSEAFMLLGYGSGATGIRCNGRN